MAAAAGDRLHAAVALLFVQGWRVSEVLGLAWGDLDLDTGTARVRRACSYADGVGMVLGPPKTDGAVGLHHLTPGVVSALRQRRTAQLEDRLRAGSLWEHHEYEGEEVELVFTTATGGLMLRQKVAKVITAAAERAGIDPKGLSTHTGRSTVITTLYTEVGLDLGDLKRWVGHADEKTTAGYVRDLGERPIKTSQAAARALDPEVGVSE